MEIVKIKDHNNLVRDIDSKAILTTDTSALERYKQQTKIFEDRKKEINEFQQMKQDIKEIKELLKILLGKN